MRLYLDANPIIYSIEGVPDFRGDAQVDRARRGTERCSDHVPFPAWNAG
jgi:hypothetical protein